MEYYGIFDGKSWDILKQKMKYSGKIRGYHGIFDGI
jgi:hypothetical protein